MNKLRTVLGPSILSADFANLQKDCQEVLSSGADSLHIDIMDGHFVPNLTIGPPVVASLRKQFPKTHLDCHLMVTDPQMYLQPLAKSRIDCFTFHYEAVPSSQQREKLCRKIKQQNIHVGVSIKPQTEQTQELIDLAHKKILDKILIMTVEPGFGGQKFMKDMMEKVQYYRERLPEIDIQVDGGINLENIVVAASSGANCFVAGSSVFGASNRQETIQEMKKLADKIFNK